ncbi:hypothetical protein C9374_002331 [Naegleria lovaniensis]|uniref:CAAX prenyl protease 2/Lysostaphin resistance protein A-like domain-containing protein n=1 Tax=Naegleria lovaniensis TaxID=51637 RepID=A0AA88GPP1_NAELO|nr:uncharacterized protein C9374_002331 [Naegleria lovaniensis]KAG2386587.1 hypothetical protein C9374_002331 [Naegleria lovaniensis]
MSSSTTGEVALSETSLRHRKNLTNDDNVEGIELTSDEEAELLKEEEEEERRKLIQSGQTPPPPSWTQSFWLRWLGIVFPIILSLGDVVLFVFEYLFTNTIVQTLLASVSFHTYRSFSSIHKCNACTMNALPQDGTFQNNNQAFSAFNEMMNLNWKECIACVVSHDYALIATNFLYVTVWTCCICYYFTWRYGVTLKRIKKPSAKAILVVSVIAIGMALMVWFQYRNNQWVYSLSNFKAIKRDTKNPFGLFGTNETDVATNLETANNEESDVASFVSEDTILTANTTNMTTPFPDLNEEGSQVDYLKMIQLLIGSPIVEEIILRVVLVHMFFRRTGKPIVSFFMTNLLFAVLHMFSINWGASELYTYFQVLAGFVLGMFYSTRYYLTENLIENAMLHIANNISAIFIPVTLKFQDVYPNYIVPIILSLSFYVIMLILDIVKIMQMPTKQIVPVIEESKNNTTNNATQQASNAVPVSTSNKKSSKKKKN